MNDAWTLTLSEGVSQIAARRLSAADWTRALLDRIDRCEPRVGAWVHLDRDGAFETAASLVGSLAGAPLGIKDIIDVAGMPCEAGSPLYRGRIAHKDAPVIARLRQAGAVPVGKTTTCELATNQPSAARNPWRDGHTPGCSSAGSAAAVACAMVPAAIGTQTGGSIIRPAAYCGVMGFKPSAGRIPTAGVLPVSWSYDHLGFFTRCIDDMALLLAATENGRPGNGVGHDTDLYKGFGVGLLSRRPGRVCYFREDSETMVSADILAAMDRAAASLEASSVQVDMRRLPYGLEQLQAVDRIIIRSEAATYHAGAFRATPERFGADMRANIITGSMIPAVDYLQAQRLRAEFAARLDEILSEYDFAIMPATRDFAPAMDDTGDPVFNTPFSGAGTPVLTLPVETGPTGLPAGIQLVGRYGEDRKLLAVGKWCEKNLDWRPKIALLEEMEAGHEP